MFVAPPFRAALLRWSPAIAYHVPSGSEELFAPLHVPLTIDGANVLILDFDVVDFASGIHSLG